MERQQELDTVAAIVVAADFPLLDRVRAAADAVRGRPPPLLDYKCALAVAFMNAQLRSLSKAMMFLL